MDIQKKKQQKQLKNGNNIVINNVKEGIDNTLEDQVNSIDKINGYINKWYKYYEEKNFSNMEYQYKKIQENIKKIIPLEDVIKKARTVENLHELIKNNGKNFELNSNEKELAEMLSN